MSRNNIHAYYHIVFGTKYSEPLLVDSLQPELYKMVWHKCKEISCEPIMINGMEDHLHILVHANEQLTISKMLKDIKGSSSRWLNEHYGFLNGFGWQRGYGLFTVSPKDVKMIARYIQNQKEHHKKGTV